ncbi:uncharacterized protein LOC119655927 [Hermetia illucens]|uniref:uncharacterized protein LOC119655927 n=1 Tax=Hermetia illucens TaxID=343691 RepID=UPI0018CC6D51|nr:uncharacterized protein LOC119655927 [Hermetia illucens]XP_037918027.1 uncharacterized protein LOC119655927 [Hermetia illucens]
MSGISTQTKSGAHMERYKARISKQRVRLNINMASSDKKSETNIKSLQDNGKSEVPKQQKQPQRKPSFERRYQGTINKQILEGSCNAEEVKKQIHIFMPASAKSIFGYSDKKGEVSSDLSSTEESSGEGNETN